MTAMLYEHYQILWLTAMHNEHVLELKPQQEAKQPP